MDSPARPTKVRHFVLLLTMAASFLLYLDRYCISFAERFIREDLALTNVQIGWMLSAFFWTYALAQVPMGFLADRHGARLMLTVFILGWSLFTGLTGLATGFVVLLGMRLAFGLFQAGAYPTAGNLISKWVTYSARGFSSSLVALGGRVGGALAPIITAFLIIYFIPESKSSLLEADDVLDYAVLSKQLLHGPFADKSKPAPQEMQVQREVTALSLSVILPQLSASSRQQLADDTTTQIPPGVLHDLNELIRQPGAFADFEFTGINLENEAKELRKRSTDQLTQGEVERLNRLVFEAAFPQAIKKLYGTGWRPAMLAFGLAGLAVAGTFWFWVRNTPAQHPWCNDAEVNLIELSRPVGIMSPHGKATRVPLPEMLGSFSMWCNCICQFGTNLGWVFLVTWLPRYLDEKFTLDIGERGLYASAPLVVGWLGTLAGGWATDRWTRAAGARWGRALPISLSRFLAMSAFLVCMFEPGLVVVTICFGLVAFGTDFGSPAMWAFNQDVGGRYVASVLGWGNMWGNLGAAVSPPLLNWVVGAGNWQQAFLTCAAAFAIAGVCGLGINALEPLVRQEE